MWIENMSDEEIQKFVEERKHRKERKLRSGRLKYNLYGINDTIDIIGSEKYIKEYFESLYEDYKDCDPIAWSGEYFYEKDNGDWINEDKDIKFSKFEATRHLNIEE